MTDELMNEVSYLRLLSDVLQHGELRGDRTGVGTRSLFGSQLQFDLSKGNFPLLTTKRMPFQVIAHELLWFISGSSNAQYLRDHNVKIWEPWTPPDGELGPLYGVQWRRWEDKHDQLAEVISQIKTDPLSRRIIMNAWNVARLDEMALPPCHVMCQFYVHTNGTLDCHMYQRSADLFLGVPFNIASYALLTTLIALVTGKRPGKLVISFGDVHIYNNHVEHVKLQLRRHPLTPPSLQIVRPTIDNIDNVSIDDLQLIGYDAHGAIPAPIAV